MRLLLPDFLNHVARGQQDQADGLLTSISEQGQDIQALLLTPGKFTDYSGRTFHCTAFEYAYWAKDIYMCRMLLNHMDESTKAEMAKRCEDMESDGLVYTLKGTPCKSAHFDFTPLKEAYQAYLDILQKSPKNNKALGQAWLNIGKQQRLVPAHVANEYCYPERSFDLLLNVVMTLYQGLSNFMIGIVAGSLGFLWAEILLGLVLILRYQHIQARMERRVTDVGTELISPQ